MEKQTIELKHPIHLYIILPLRSENHEGNTSLSDQEGSSSFNTENMCFLKHCFANFQLVFKQYNYQLYLCTFLIFIFTKHKIYKIS